MQADQFLLDPPVSETSSIATAGSFTSDIAKDEAIARLEKLIMDERAEREARDAAREAAMAKAAADKLAAEERAAADKILMSYAYKRVTGKNHDI